MKPEITKENLEKIIKESVSLGEVIRKLNFHNNKKGYSKIRNLIKDFNLDTSCLCVNSSLSNSRRLYPKITKECPVCKTPFIAEFGNPREKQTCSWGCSNKFFAHKRAKDENLKQYRTICFRFWKKECLICKFKEVVEVHHFDENHSNNEPKNLIPLCANHHQMIHTNKWKEKLQKEVTEKINGKEGVMKPFGSGS